jgi:RNA polymerase sigma-70 factor (ECF subfamily)
MSALPAVRLETDPNDDDVVAMVLGGDRESFAILVRRHNQTLFRACRAVLHDDGEAEDAVQTAWINIYRALATFRGEARFRTWATRIAVHEASAARRKQQTRAAISIAPARPNAHADPEHEAISEELGRVLEREITSLPETLRSVVVLRDVIELDTSETATCLGLTDDAVRVRLHRGRTELARRLADRAPELRGSISNVWRFAGERCARTLRAVMTAIA